MRGKITGVGRTGGPSYREAKGGAFELFHHIHHKCPVSSVTDLEPPVGDNGDRPICQGRGAPVSQETAPQIG
jgi:hypothetical protein